MTIVTDNGTQHLEQLKIPPMHSQSRELFGYRRIPYIAKDALQIFLQTYRLKSSFRDQLMSCWVKGLGSRFNVVIDYKANEKKMQVKKEALGFRYYSSWDPK